MKKYLLSLALLMSALGTMAQERWFDTAEGPDETVLYLQVVDGEDPTMPVGGMLGTSQIAAFVGGECRAVESNYFMDETGMMYDGIYRLRVKGNMGASATDATSDFKKDIVLKLYNMMDGFVYKFTTTFKFDGESHGTPSTPVKVKLLMATQFDAITIDGTEMKEENGWFVEYLYLPLPGQLNLNEAVKLTYGNGRLTENTVSPIDTDETPIEFSYESPGAPQYFTIEDGVLTAQQVTYNADYENDPDNGQALNISLMGGHQMAWKSVFVVIKNRVESIATDLTELTVYSRDNLMPYLDGHVTILPANATNTSYYIEEVNAEMDPTGAPNGHLYENTAIMPGTCQIRIVSSDDPTKKSAEISLTILERPYGIQIKDGETAELELGVGQDLMAALNGIIDVLPVEGEYVDRTLGIESEKSLWNESFITTTTGEVWLNVYPKAQIFDATGAEGHDVVRVHLTVFQSLERISADNTDVLVYVGADVFEEIYGRVTFEPATASDKGLHYTIADMSIVDREGIAIASGTTKVTAIANDNELLTIDFNVTVKEPLGFSISDVTASKYNDVELTLTKTGDDEIDGSKVELVFPNHANEGWGAVATAVKTDNTGLKWKVRGKYFGQYRYQVRYDGGIIPGVVAALDIPVEYEYKEGWNWLSIPASVPDWENPAGFEMKSFDLNSDQDLMNAENPTRSNIYEARTQYGLTINDPTYGFVGDFTKIEANGQLYKVKATAAGRMLFGSGMPEMISSSTRVMTGYTWMAYPHEIDHSLATLNATLSNEAITGDLIIGKDGFAAFTGQNWSSSDANFKFEAGKGYIFYTTEVHPLNWGDQTLAPEPAAARSAMRPSVWKFDNSRFSESMAIIASVEGLENPENYTVGAFVDNECRGRGTCVEGRWMFISVGGQMGETISFRLHNELTGEYTDLPATLGFGRIAGGIERPVDLFTNTTGITSTYRNSLPAESYDLSGRRMAAGAKGVSLQRTADGKVRKVVKN